MNKKTKNFYSLAEASEILGLSRQTLVRLIRDEKVPGVKLGRQYRIPRKPIDRIVKDAASFEMTAR